MDISPPLRAEGDGSRRKSAGEGIFWDDDFIWRKKLNGSQRLGDVWNAAETYGFPACFFVREEEGAKSGFRPSARSVMGHDGISGEE
jgi:hypothetical protein